MASRNIMYSLPQPLVSAIRKADVLTGRFLRPVSAEALSQLEAIGLASDGGLTDWGMELRSWLMSGTRRAPAEVSRLLGEIRDRLMAEARSPFAGSPSPLEMIETPSLLPSPREIAPYERAAAKRGGGWGTGDFGVHQH